MSGLAWLTPLGLDSAEVESLASLVRRLAYAEVRPVTALLRELVVEPYRVRHGHAHPIIQPSRSTEAINGTSRATRLVVEALASLGAIQVVRSTLLSRDGGIEFDQAFRATRAWCPSCLAEDGLAPYDRLVWSLVVQARCNRHGSVLVDRCRRCYRGHRPWHPRANPWACPWCGEELANAVPQLPSPATSPATPLVGFLEGGGVATASAVSAAFTWLAQRVGGRNRLSAQLASPASVISTACSGTRRPQLGLFLGALNLAGEPLDAFLAHPRPRARRPRKAVARPPPLIVAAPTLRAELLAALARTNPPSLRAFASSQHLGPATIRARLPTLARELVACHAKAERACHARAERRLVNSVRTSFRALTRSGVPPTRRQIEAVLDKPGVFRAPLAQRAYRECLAGSGEEPN